jgi:hypothetical protein
MQYSDLFSKRHDIRHGLCKRLFIYPQLAMSDRIAFKILYEHVPKRVQVLTIPLLLTFGSLTG